jgi:hypothetical protein
MRRFPSPWTAEELDACFVVRDHNGQQLAYVYFEDEPGPRAAPDTDACRGDGRTVVARWTVTTVARRCCAWRSLEAVDCHKRRPYQGRARYHHEKRYCS